MGCSRVSLKQVGRRESHGSCCQEGQAGKGRQAASGAPRDRNSPGPPSAYTILRPCKAVGYLTRAFLQECMHLLAWTGQQQATSHKPCLPPPLAPHRMVRPLKSLPLRLRMADSAVGMSKNSMKPNPRGLPVSRSVTILRSSGSPRTRQFNEAGRAPAAPPPHRLR